MTRVLRRQSVRKRSGVALLLVLWLVVLLATVTMAASGAARSSGTMVTTRRAEATAQSMAESGIAAATTAINDSIRALVADSVARDNFLNALDAGTNNGNSAIGRASSDTLVDGAFATAVVDVSSRLDVNNAGETALTKFLSAYTNTTDATLIASRITSRVRGENLPNDSARISELARDSVVRALLGQKDAGSVRHPFESLDELLQITGVDEKLLAQIVPFLTVDGNSTINKRSAPAPVLAAATGSQTEAPTRLLIVSRGWQIGHPLSHEIQAVYDVSSSGLRLVRWRERTL